MSKERGLTGIEERARGFVGGVQSIKFYYVGTGRACLRFDISCNKPDAEKLKFTIWRHCVVYGEMAEDFKNIRPGDLVAVRGWLELEARRDDYGRPIVEDGQIVKRETLICWEIGKREHEKLQPALMPAAMPV